MLNDIRLHLDADEKAQANREQIFLATINQRYIRNREALIRYIPSIGNQLDKIHNNQLSIFVDKNGEINLVEIQSGKTVYAPNSDSSIEQQFLSWASNSAWLNLSENKSEYSPLMTNKANNHSQNITFHQLSNYAAQLEEWQTNKPIDTLVCLGMGKATFLKHLLDSLLKNQPRAAASLDVSNLKYLVCYEPNWELFKCSLYCFDWANLLEQAESLSLQLFLQIGTNVSDIYSDISELNKQVGAEQILFFKHLNMPVYNNLIRNIRLGFWNASVTQSNTIEAERKHHNHYLHLFSSVNVDQWKEASIQHRKFEQNMQAFKEYYPDIHSAFSNYSPHCWQVIHNAKRDLFNVYNQYSHSFMHNNQPDVETKMQAEHFVQYPSYDGLVLGYAGKKLKHYLHNSFARQSDFILREYENTKGSLPDSVKVLMVLGLGSGYLLECVYHQKDIQNLVVCEPNPDMFYASLFVIDWKAIIDKVETNEYQLYINIGEASSRLFKDVMSQFMQLGPYLLNETYILQCYQNPHLEQVFYEVRQQLQVLFAMGENFDHVAYGIAHTMLALKSKIPAMRFNPKAFLTSDNKQTPVFIVGNGPSLDENIEVIKEHREQVIVVSCGTALQALHRYNITPDFHGEVEQCRANYDWASRIGDFDYLKKITLISVNGIHPDTYSLYKDVLFTFKSGESSTHTALSLVPANSYNVVEYAYPTVTNMALSFFLALGFEQLYLVGVDLGFASKAKHHSSASGYYENGKQIYNYQATHTPDLKVRGNRQPWVFTKTEFNISRMLIEQLLLDSNQGLSASSECFNLSNGVMIDGTIPLEPSTVLIINSPEQKKSSIDALSKCFIRLDNDIYSSLEKAYLLPKFREQQQALFSICSSTVLNKFDVEQIIVRHSTFLTETKMQGKSLFFYYYYNAIYACNAALTKAILIDDESLSVEASRKIIAIWLVFLNDAEHMTSDYLSLLDSAESFSDKRESILIDLHKSKTTSLPAPAITNTNKVSTQLTPVTFFVKDNDYFNVISKQQQILETKLLAVINDASHLFNLISWIDNNTSNNQSSSIVALLIRTKQDAHFYLEHIQTFISSHPTATPLSKLNIVLVFTCDELIKCFAEEYKDILKVLCVLYIPPIIECMSYSYKQKFETGDLPGIGELAFTKQILLKSQNFTLFNVIFNKPSFQKAGLENALQNEKYEQKEVSNKQSNQLENINVNNGNEYQSKAVVNIQRGLIDNYPLWQQPFRCYMFKHYIGVSITKNDANITLLDKTYNRGLLIARVPFAFEFLGPWLDS